MTCQQTILQTDRLTKAKDFVVSKYPLAECFPCASIGGKYLGYWFVTTPNGSLNTLLGKGYSEEEAWVSAAENIVEGLKFKI